MGKVVLIGVDCGNLDLIMKWIDELPTFKSLIENGASGRIASTFPANTVPAWNCIFSGKNPGKLGVYDFVTIPYYAPHGLEPASYKLTKTNYLWNILSKNSVRSAIINVPITFPPEEIEGIMVSGGLLTPFYKETRFTFPSELKEEINRISGGYEILPFTDLTIPGKEEEYLQKILSNIEKQTRVVTYLMQKYDWDFLTYVFFVTDSVQHYFWHHIDPSHPRYVENIQNPWRDAIKTVYRRVDAKLGEILSKLPSESDVLLTSDHGSGPLHNYFLVNEWLKKSGFLALRDSRPHNSYSEVWLWRGKNFLLKNFPHLSEKMASALPRRFTSRFLVKGQLRNSYQELINRVDWTKTKAYGIGSDGAIFVNLKGREPNGIVAKEDYETVRSEIISRLHEIRNPATGQELAVETYRREEVYNGDYAELAPDILYILDGLKYEQRADIGFRTVWRPSYTSGGHSPHGAFIAFGRNIRRDGKRIEGSCIYDITPTILHMLGIPIPDDLDGHVLKEIFPEGSEIRERSPQYRHYSLEHGKSVPSFTDAEEKQVRERLEKLGYM